MGHIHFTHCYTMVHLLVRLKVIYPKYSKHWPHTVAHTIDCVSIVMLNHGLNHSLTFQAFLMKIHSKLIKFRINIKTKLLQIYDFRSQVFTWSTNYFAPNQPILICPNGCAENLFSNVYSIWDVQLWYDYACCWTVVPLLKMLHFSDLSMHTTCKQNIMY